MLIGIDFSLATSTCRGMGRYVREIVSCLMKLDTNNIMVDNMRLGTLNKSPPYV